MMTCSQQVRAAIERGEKPQALLVITTRGGRYVHSDQALSDALKSGVGRAKADGTRQADGTWTAGGDPVLLGGGKTVTRWASLKEALSSSQRSLKAGLTQSDPDNLTVQVAAEADPPGPSPLGARAELMLVWPGVLVRDGLVVFRGEVAGRKRQRAGTQYKLVSVGQGLRDSLKLPVNLRKASAYAHPRREAATLPLVLGDMTVGGSGGQWEALCIDTTTFVYALAGHELDGGVELYDKDDALISPSDYTLNLAHDFEGQGVIATATFAADAKDREPIGVRARGKPGDAGLLSNPVDIARELLINHGGLAESDLDAASWSRARRACQVQGYQAARAIVREAGRGDLLTGLLTNFAVYWWIGGDGRLRLVADVPGFVATETIAGHFSPKKVELLEADEASTDICNQLKVRYALKLAGGETWQAEDDGFATRDAISQQRHQVRLWELDLPWVRDASTARAVQRVRIGRLARGLGLYKATVKDCRQILVERGDFVTLSSNWLRDQNGQMLSYQIMWVEQKQTDPATGASLFLLRDTGLFRTVAYKADGSHQADGTWLAGGERKLEEQ